MGVKSEPDGVMVAVMDWSTGRKELRFAGRVSTAEAETIATMAVMYRVQRGLVDPRPDDALAKQLMQVLPSVFAIQGGDNNASSLAEIAYRRMAASPNEIFDAEPNTDWGVLGVGITNREQGAVLRAGEEGAAVVHVRVPAHRPIPTHVMLPLGEPVVLEGTGGERIVEASVNVGEAVPHHRAIFGEHPGLSIAPSQLPTTGWHIAVDLYAGPTLVYEWLSVEGQVMGIGNLIKPIMENVEHWIAENAVNIAKQYPDANAGPLTPPPPPPY